MKRGSLQPRTWGRLMDVIIKGEKSLPQYFQCSLLHELDVRFATNFVFHFLLLMFNNRETDLLRQNPLRNFPSNSFRWSNNYSTLFVVNFNISIWILCVRSTAKKSCPSSLSWFWICQRQRLLSFIHCLLVLVLGFWLVPENNVVFLVVDWIRLSVYL